MRAGMGVSVRVRDSRRTKNESTVDPTSVSGIRWV